MITVPMPPRKLDVLRGHMERGQWRGALKLAAGFGDLGKEKASIGRGWEACARPEFYLSIGKDPDELVRLGIAALKRRYAVRAPSISKNDRRKR